VQSSEFELKKAESRKVVVRGEGMGKMVGGRGIWLMSKGTLIP
jgi:hypothetical protein